MSLLRPPRLDDRTYEDLRRELLRRIPVHSTTWTDHNPADPGITLLELFAWLTQNTLYRLNSVPDRALAQFLDLLGVPVRPAQAATALVRFRIKDKNIQPRVLEFSPSSPRTLIAAGKIEFQVQSELQVLPVDGHAVIKAANPDPARIVGEKELHSLLVQSGLLAPTESADALEPYVTYALPAPVNGELPRATSLASAVDTSLWIALLVPLHMNGIVTPSDVAIDLAGGVLSIGVRLDDELCDVEDELGRGNHQWDHHTCPTRGTPAELERLRWQIATGRFTGASANVAPSAVDPADARYEELIVEEDSTYGLTRSGVVRVRLPATADRIGTWTGDDLPDEKLLGCSALPPLVSDEELLSRVVTWIRCFREAGRGRLPEDVVHPSVRWVGVNVVPALQAVTAGGEILGRGRGTSGQSLRLAHAPVLPDSLLLEVREPSGWVRWERVDDFAASAPDDPHFVLEAATGTVTFGNGKNGRLLRIGELARARTYRYGGGAIGNVPAGALTRIARVPRDVVGLEVVNDLAAQGGRDGETLLEAKVRIPAVLRHRDRAVAAQDFVDVAMETPGVHVGRVEVLPRHKPHERVDGVPGVVTLIVVPAYDALHPDEPLPDREMLRAVCEHLEPRRLVTTELYVTPPEYVRIWISVSIEIEEGYGLATVRRWVDLALRQHFAPLPPYGPKGAGWPIGRDVSSADVMAAVLRVEGVRLVNAALLSGNAIDRRGNPSRVDGQVALLDWQLPSLQSVQVSEGEEAEPIDMREGDAMRPSREGGLHVPVEEEVC